MDVHDEFVPAETFGACVDALPQVYVEVLLECDGGVLVARRTNEPAKGEWVWPGGRLYRGERLADAARRVARAERRRGRRRRAGRRLRPLLGRRRRPGRRLPAHGQRRLPGMPARPRGEVTLDDQHDAYRFVTGEESGLHEYVRLYLDDPALGET